MANMLLLYLLSFTDPTGPQQGTSSNQIKYANSTPERSQKSIWWFASGFAQVEPAEYLSCKHDQIPKCDDACTAVLI